jgi:hypothetical protein
MQAMIVHSAAALSCSSTITPPPCLQQVFLLTSNQSLENIALLSRATGYQYPCFDAIPSHLILKSWWRTDRIHSYNANELILIWKEQLTRPGLPNRHQQGAIRTVFNNLSRKSLQEAIALGQEVLAAVEEEVNLAHMSFNEHNLAVSRLELQCQQAHST